MAARPRRTASPSWSGPIRAAATSRSDGETAIDICAYAAHMAALLGAHIIKVKPPTAHLELDAAKKIYEKQKIDISTLAKRIAHVVQSGFNGRRIVVFSGGEAKDLDGVYDEVRAIRDGGANGSIIGRNTFQRPQATRRSRCSTRSSTSTRARPDARPMPTATERRRGSI